MRVRYALIYADTTAKAVAIAAGLVITEPSRHGVEEAVQRDTQSSVGARGSSGAVVER